MKKRIYSKKFQRSTTARRAMFRSLARSLFEFGKTKTTLAKAKALVSHADKYLSMAKTDDLSTRRRMLAQLTNDRKTVNRVFEIAKANSQKSGLVKLTPMPTRRGDNSKLALVEIINMPEKNDKKEKAVKKDDKNNAKNDKTGKKKVRTEKKIKSKEKKESK